MWGVPVARQESRREGQAGATIPAPHARSPAGGRSRLGGNGSQGHETAGSTAVYCYRLVWPRAIPSRGLDSRFLVTRPQSEAGRSHCQRTIVTTGKTAQLITVPNTPLPFSPKEVELIREMLSTSTEPPTCLLCGSELHVSLSRGGGEANRVWRVDCAVCHRTAIVPETGGRRPTQQDE